MQSIPRIAGSFLDPDAPRRFSGDEFGCVQSRNADMCLEHPRSHLVIHIPEPFATANIGKAAEQWMTLPRNAFASLIEHQGRFRNRKFMT